MEANAALRNIVRGLLGGCWSAWPRRAVSRHPRLRTWRVWTGQEALEPGPGFPGATPRPRSPRKDGTTHLAYKPEHAVDLDTGAVVAAELHPADEGDTTTLPKTLAAAEANLEAVDVAPTAEDPAECVTDGLPLTVGLEGARRRPLEEPQSPSPSRRVLRAGTEMMRLAGRSPTTGPGCYRGWPGKPSSARRDRRALLCPQPRSRRYAPDLASGPRERAQAIPASRRRPQPIVADAPTHRRRHPEGGRGGRNWRLVRAR